VHDAAPTHHLFGWCTLRHFIRVLAKSQPDPSHPSRGWRIIAAALPGTSHSARPGHLRGEAGRALACPGTFVPPTQHLYGCWTRRIVRRSHPPSRGSAGTVRTVETTSRESLAYPSRRVHVQASLASPSSRKHYPSSRNHYPKSRSHYPNSRNHYPNISRNHFHIGTPAASGGSAF